MTHSWLSHAIMSWAMAITEGLDSKGVSPGTESLPSAESFPIPEVSGVVLSVKELDCFLKVGLVYQLPGVYRSKQVVKKFCTFCTHSCQKPRSLVIHSMCIPLSS